MAIKCVDVLMDTVCKISDIDIPLCKNIFTIQAKGFVFRCKVPPRLKHCYALPSPEFGNMTWALMAKPPSTIRMKDTEKLLIDKAVYEGVLVKKEGGLKECLPRPIKYFYAPPLVSIVENEAGGVRAILVDAAYALVIDNKNQVKDKTLAELDDHIRLCMQQNKISEAQEHYVAFRYECMRVAKEQQLQEAEP